MNRITILILLFTAIEAFASSCSKDGTSSKSESPYQNISGETNLNFEEGAATKNVTVDSNVDWSCSVQGGASWLSAEKQNDAIAISVTENEEKSVRQASIVVTAESLSKTINVAQLGWGKAILLSSTSATIAAMGETIQVDVTTNVEYEAAIETGCDWITTSETRSETHPVVTTTSSFSIHPNGDNGQRSATITFSDSDNSSDLKSVVFTVTQKGLGNYSAIDPDEIKDDIKVEVTGGEASSYHTGEEIDKSYDGDMETLYHSNYDNSGSNYFPITLTYYFDSGSAIDYFIYYPRTSGSNGIFKEVDIEVRSNANTRGEDEWTEVMSYDFKGSSSATKVTFSDPLIGVSAIRFTVKSGVGNFAFCAEMEFYKKNPDAFDYSTLFTDVTCSELKDGVTEDDIMNCEYSFFKNIAWYLYNNKYESEFRIATFKAYPYPDTQASSNKTSPYSLLDNPTGISLAEGDVLVVLAKLNGKNVSLRVQNLDEPNGDGFGGDEYPLSEGTNKFTIRNKGLAYVMYHEDDYESAPELKLHFASGTVNGYYDSQNPDHANRWKELLDNASDQYFDVVGKYAHLTFPTSRFRNYTKNLDSLINVYDKIVYNEQELMGLAKYDKMFKNRMYFNVIYTSYMYATSYHTAYNDETLSELCDETKLSTSSCWGPAHEVGHCNQTRPGLKWLGTTEVTNNIMSEYIQTTILGQPSRVQTESMNDDTSPNRYSKAWNGIIVPGIAHGAHDDVFCKLIPFWQLELYFGKVLGRTPKQQSDKGGFYPDVYEYIRTHDDLETAGEQQLEFVYIASLAAKANLLDFFEKWGFLTPCDLTIDDYGTGNLKITQDQVDEIKSRVEALGYEKPQVALEYITDNNYITFKNQEQIVKGTASRSGTKLTMSNWENVIAYEVRDGAEDGTLICVSDGILTPSTTASFSVPDSWKDTYSVYAVSFDNTRVKVDL